MTFEELKALLREWYEAGREIDLKNPDSLERFYEVQLGLMEYARTLCEGRKAEVTE